MAKLGQFLRETRAEMKHVTWPTRHRAMIYALVVIIFSVVLGYLLFGFDALFQTALRSILAF
jgi:preprotein translocase subunit SecE